MASDGDASASHSSSWSGFVRAARSGLETLSGFLERLPVVEDFVFWMLENAFVLAYVGVFELIFRTGPGLVYSALAVVAALLYVLLARRRYADRAQGVVEVALLMSALVLVGDLIVTGGLSAFSVLIDVSSILLAFNCYKEHRRVKLLKDEKPS